MYPPKLYSGPTIQSRSAAQRAAQDLVFQNIPNNYIQKKMGGVRCQEVTLSHSEAPFSLAIFFFPFSLRCNLSGGVSAISRDMEACFFLSFLPSSLIHFHGQALNLPDHWL